MNNLDVAGILRTYSEKARRAKSTEQLREIIRDETGEVICKRFNTFRDPDFYCAYGERRDNV